MIRANSITLQRGLKVLFQSATFTLNPGEKVGLIGDNGAGKSSLFSLFLNELHEDGGSLEIPTAWVRAHVAQHVEALDKPALDFVVDGDVRLRNIQAELSIAEAKEHDFDGEHLAELYAQIQDADGHTAAARAQALLLGLGFSVADTLLPVSEFSGGWQQRLALAQALMCRSDLLLLDEPTNHLDLDAIVWLEEWLKRYAGTLIIISHDREFLDAVCDTILHIDAQKILRYNGNYSSFERQVAERLALQQSAFVKQQREVKHLQSFIARFKAKASKAKQAQSRVKALERMELIAPAHAGSPFSFEFREPLATPVQLLVTKQIECGYVNEETAQRTVILQGIELNIRHGERIGLLGKNGQGKSTLIKTLAGTLAPLSGHRREGKGLAVGYFAQHQMESLRLTDTPLQHLVRIAGNTREQELRNFLGGFNFHGEMATSVIAPFSGGEKARLALALIIWQRPNLLLLDEPTNHLDMETRHALTMALSMFEGTLILVSHDRSLLRATCDNFMLVAEGGVAPFDGDLDDYRIWLTQQTQQQQSGKTAGRNSGKIDKVADTSVKNQAENAVMPKNSARAPKMGIEAKIEAKIESNISADEKREQKRVEAEQRQALASKRKPLLERNKRIEREMEKLNAQKHTLDTQIAHPATYDDADKARQLVLDLAYLNKQLDGLELEWLDVQEGLENIS